LIQRITTLSNLTVRCNKINVPVFYFASSVLNGNVSCLHCLLLIVCQGTRIWTPATLPFNTGTLILLQLTVRLDVLVIQNMSTLSNLTVRCNKINVPVFYFASSVLNGNVSCVHCLLLIVCQGTRILYYQYV
jgi:sRNA-binding regulator protein Hfq